MNYWLIKSEPKTFSIDDLIAAPKQTEPWDGIRNYQARNMMRDQMKLGDRIFFYHSNCNTPGIVGTVQVARASHPDPTQFQKNSPYYDPKATLAQPRWFMVAVQFIEKFKHPVPLNTLKMLPELTNVALIKKGNRLSIIPISEKIWSVIIKLSKQIDSSQASDKKV